MKVNIANYFKEKEFKVKDSVILSSARFKNKCATIKELDDENGIALVILAADGETARVDYEEMKENNEPYDPEMSDLTPQSIQQDDEYRPIGRGTGKERDAFHTVGQALRKIERELGNIKVPIVAVRYQSSDIKRWNNAINCAWTAEIKFNIDFLDKRGKKHSATVGVPIENGLIQKAEYFHDNLNRRFSLTSEGVQNYLDQIDWLGIGDEKNEEAIWQVPGQAPPTANVSIIKMKKTASDNKMIEILEKQAGLNKKAFEPPKDIPRFEEPDVEGELTEEEALEMKDKIREEIPVLMDSDFIVWKSGDKIMVQERTDGELFGHEYIVDFDKQELIPHIIGANKQAKLNKKAEKFEIGERIKVTEGSGVASGKEGMVVNRDEIQIDGRGIPINVEGAYKPIDWAKEIAIQYDDGSYDTMYKNRLIKTEARLNKKAMTKEEMFSRFAAGPWGKIKRIIKDDDDREKVRELLSLREVVDEEILKQQEENEKNGLERNDHVNLKHRRGLDNMFFDVLEKYRGGIEEYFAEPRESKIIVDRVLRNIKAKENIQAAKPLDELMDTEKEEQGLIEPGKKKKTKHKSITKQDERDMEMTDSPVPAGIGNREFNDMSDREPNETKFVH